MFWMGRRKATSAIVDGLRPLVAIVQHARGLPPRFWLDPYVIGFFTSLATSHAKLATAGKITGGDLGRALSDGMGRVSNMNGAEIVMEGVRLAGVEDGSYFQGVDDALVIFHFTLGNLRDERSNALIVRAAEMAGGFGDRGRVAGMLFQTTFMRRIEDRLFS